MTMPWVLLGAAVTLALSGCASSEPRTEAERQQQRADAQADSARDVADAHKDANKEVRKANQDLRSAENETLKREASAQQSRLDEAEAINRSTAAPGIAREQIRTAEAEANYRSDRQRCEPLWDQERSACIAAADAKLDQARQSE